MEKIEIIDKTKSPNKTLFSKIIPSILESDEKLVNVLDDPGSYLAIKKGSWLRRKTIVAFFGVFLEYPIKIDVYTERGLEVAKKIGEQDDRGAVINKHYS